MLLWCSICVSRTSSPGPTFLRPQAWATRLIASVALRVKIVVSGCRVHVARRSRSRAPSKAVGRALGQLVGAAVDRRVVLAVELVDRLDHLARLLAGRGAVEVDQPLAADLLLEDREVGAQRAGRPVRHRRSASLAA